MTIQWGDTGKVAYGVQKTFTLQSATPREVSLGTLSLPNAEGTTNQVSFTVQQSDLPTVTPNPVSMKYIACIITSGKCVTAATISYRIFKNSTSLTTSSASGLANQYWTDTHWRWFDVQVGDVLEVRHWSNQTDTNLDFACLMILPASVVLSKVNTILSNLTYSLGTTTNFPNPTGAGLRSVSVSSTLQSNFCIAPNIASVGTANGCYAINTTSGAIAIFPNIVSSSFGVLRTNTGGDGAATTTQNFNHATNISIQKQATPNNISFREILR